MDETIENLTPETRLIGITAGDVQALIADAKKSVIIEIHKKAPRFKTKNLLEGKKLYDKSRLEGEIEGWNSYRIGLMKVIRGMRNTNFRGVKVAK